MKQIVFNSAIALSLAGSLTGCVQPNIGTSSAKTAATGASAGEH